MSKLYDNKLDIEHNSGRSRNNNWKLEVENKTTENRKRFAQKILRNSIF